MEKRLSNNINVYIHDSENESVPMYKTKQVYKILGDFTKTTVAIPAVAHNPQWKKGFYCKSYAWESENLNHFYRILYSRGCNPEFLHHFILTLGKKRIIKDLTITVNDHLLEDKD